MATKTKTVERMDHRFSVFNLHVNNAGKRANAEFIAQFGQEAYDKEIQPSYDEGIMSIFNKEQTVLRSCWVCLVTAYANEERGK